MISRGTVEDVFTGPARSSRATPPRKTRCDSAKGQTVNEALREFIERRQRLELVKLFGKVEYDRTYENVAHGDPHEHVRALARLQA
jgi:hypothetical protein